MVVVMVELNRKRGNNMIDLKEYRTSRGLSQMTMASKLGVAMNTYILWERKINNPNEENQKKIDEVLRKGDK